MEHIARSDLLAFFTMPSRALHARVAGHLLEGCSACLTDAQQVHFIGDGPCQADLSDIILVEAALLKDERQKAPVSWARIADMDEKRRFKAIQTRRGLRKYGLAVFVLEEAESFADRGRTGRAAELVRASAAIAECLPARIYGEAPPPPPRQRNGSGPGSRSATDRPA